MVREPRRTALPYGSQSWVYGKGVVSGLSLVNHSDSGSFVVVCKLSQDGFRPEGFWELVGYLDWCLLSPFD